jgi:hypothetical protein
MVSKAKNIHSDKYSYSKKEYKSMTEYMNIWCNFHKENFRQKPHKHIKGRGCPECGKLKRIENSSLTWEKFILQAAQKWPGITFLPYGNYLKGREGKASFICQKHGTQIRPVFEILNKSILCASCSRYEASQRAGISQRMPFKDFVKKAQSIYKEKYAYEEESYQGVSKNIIIICSEHGKFSLKGHDHLRGVPCPKCSFTRSRPERLIRSIFEENFVCFYEQFKPKELKGLKKGQLSFDFMLRCERLIIEYDGRHHFEPAFGSTPEKAQEVFERTQAHDKLKNHWAKENGFEIIRLSNERTLRKDLEEIISTL